LAGDASEIDGAVGQPRRRFRWAGRAAAPALLRADRKEATEQHRAEQRAAEQGSHAFSPTPTRRGRPSGRPARWPGLKARPYVRVFETEASRSARSAMLLLLLARVVLARRREQPLAGRREDHDARVADVRSVLGLAAFDGHDIADLQRVARPAL